MSVGGLRNKMCNPPTKTGNRMGDMKTKKPEPKAKVKIKSLNPTKDVKGGAVSKPGSNSASVIAVSHE